MRSPSVLVFPALVFPFVDPLTGTLYSFALFSLAFVGRPIGTLLFTFLDQKHGRGVKLTIALFLLGGSTMAIALLPGYAAGRRGQHLAARLLPLVPGHCARAARGTGCRRCCRSTRRATRRGWYAMIPQLGAPLGLIVASALFAYFLAHPARREDFLSWGWRYPFFVALAINVVALFARLRLVATPEFKRLFENRELQPSPPFETLRKEWRTIALGAFAPLASFALFHLVTVFPLVVGAADHRREPGALPAARGGRRGRLRAGDARRRA